MIKPTCGSKYRFLMANGDKITGYWQDADYIAGNEVVRLSDNQGTGLGAGRESVAGEFWIVVKNVLCFWRVE